MMLVVDVTGVAHEWLLTRLRGEASSPFAWTRFGWVLSWRSGCLCVRGVTTRQLFSRPAVSAQFERTSNRVTFRAWPNPIAVIIGMFVSGLVAMGAGHLAALPLPRAVTDHPWAAAMGVLVFQCAITLIVCAATGRQEAERLRDHVVAEADFVRLSRGGSYRSD